MWQLCKVCQARWWLRASARAETRAPDNHSNLIAVTLVGHLKYVNARLFEHAARLWTAHPCRAPLPSTVLALTPRCTAAHRRAEPTESTCGEAANLHGESPLGAHARLPTTHALRPIALVAARCQPAPCSHLPPSTLGRALPATVSRSTAPLPIVLTGTHHAHRRNAQRRHAQWHPRVAASCATAPRSMRSSCLRSRCTASIQSAVGHACVCRPKPAQTHVRRCTTMPLVVPRCTVNSAHVSRCEPCPCGVGSCAVPRVSCL